MSEENLSDIIKDVKEKISEVDDDWHITITKKFGIPPFYTFTIRLEQKD